MTSPETFHEDPETSGPISALLARCLVDPRAGVGTRGPEFAAERDYLYLVAVRCCNTEEPLVAWHMLAALLADPAAGDALVAHLRVPEARVSEERRPPGSEAAPFQVAPGIQVLKITSGLSTLAACLCCTDRSPLAVSAADTLALVFKLLRGGKAFAEHCLGAAHESFTPLARDAIRKSVQVSVVNLRLFPAMRRMSVAAQLDAYGPLLVALGTPSLTPLHLCRVPGERPGLIMTLYAVRRVMQTCAHEEGEPAKALLVVLRNAWARVMPGLLAACAAPASLSAQPDTAPDMVMALLGLLNASDPATLLTAAISAEVFAACRALLGLRGAPDFCFLDGRFWECVAQVLETSEAMSRAIRK